MWYEHLEVGFLYKVTNLRVEDEQERCEGIA